MTVSAPLAQAEGIADRKSLQAVEAVDGAATGSIDDLGVTDGTVSFDDLDVRISGADSEPRTVDNAVLLEGDDGVDHVVRMMEDGTQFLSIINQKDESTEVRYDFPSPRRPKLFREQPALRPAFTQAVPTRQVSASPSR